MSMTMSTPSRTSLHLHLAYRDLQRSPRGSVTWCTAAKTPYNGFNVIPLLSVDVNAIELVSELFFYRLKNIGRTSDIPLEILKFPDLLLASFQISEIPLTNTQLGKENWRSILKLL